MTQKSSPINSSIAKRVLTRRSKYPWLHSGKRLPFLSRNSRLPRSNQERLLPGQEQDPDWLLSREAGFGRGGVFEGFGFRI